MKRPALFAYEALRAFARSHCLWGIGRFALGPRNFFQAEIEALEVELAAHESPIIGDGEYDLWHADKDQGHRCEQLAVRCKGNRNRYRGEAHDKQGHLAIIAWATSAGAILASAHHHSRCLDLEGSSKLWYARDGDLGSSRWAYLPVIPNGGLLRLRAFST